MTAPSRVVVRVWHITHAVAEKFLATERQPKKGEKATNRRFSPQVVNDYAFEMLSKAPDDDGILRSRWGFSHEGFAFTGFLSDGTAEMKDGGQRCRALVQACTVGATKGDKTLPPDPDFAFDVFVTEGLDEDSWRVMNIGRRRTPADFLVMDGETNGAVLGATIQLCHLYENLNPGTPYFRDYWIKGSLSPAARKDYLDAN